ncbi:MAG: tetratricopeptide repeat protein [Ignavibacteriaceae bacterium]|nr:tetratricopeptide repeat protein [Ignavibacteriaceae bacterium]
MKKTLTILLCIATYLSGQSISEKFNSAMNSYNALQFVEANRLFDQFMEKHIEYDELFATAKFFSAMSLLKTGNFDASEIRFAYIVKNFVWSAFRDKSLYELGLIYFDKKDYASSRLNFKKLLDEYPESDYSGSALYWIGESYSKENKLKDAVNLLLQALQDRKNNKFIDYTIYTLASVYEKMQDYENAEKYYDQLISYHNESPLVNAARIRIGMCYFKLKDYQSSIIEMNNPVLNELPANLFSESLYLLANSYYRVQDYAKAEKTYIEILQKYSSASIIREVSYGLAWTYFQQKKYNDAYNVFNSLSDDTDSLAVKSFYWKGESKRYAGQEEDALDIYFEFLKRYSDSKLAETIRYQVGVLYFNTGKYDLAEQYLSAALNSYDNSIKARAFTMLGELSLAKKDYNSAKDYFNKALDVPNVEIDLQNRSLLGLGVAYYYLQNYDDAITSLTEIDKREPNFEKDKLNFYLAENLFAMGSYEQAIQRYNNVNLADNMFGNQALYGKAYCLFNLKQYDHSAEIFSEFIKKFSYDEKIKDAKLRLADCYYGSKNYSAASLIYKEMFKEGSSGIDDPFTYFQYAQSLFKGGDANQAITEFNNLQHKFPDSPYAERSLYLIGWINFQQNNYKLAIICYNNVLNVYPSSALRPAIYYSLGDTYYNMENYDSAIVNYQRVLTEFPSSNYVFDAINGIQYAYIAQGKPEKAVSLINDFVAKNPESNFADKLYFKKGEIYYSRKQYDKARISYNEFITSFPNNSLIPDAWYWMGKSSQNLGQDNNAIQYYTNVFNDYPDKEIAASSVIEMATIYNTRKDYNSALDILNKAIDKLSKSPRLPELKFMKAETMINNSNINDAYDVFGDIVQNYPSNLFSDKSKIELGLIDLAAQRYDNASVYFKSLSDTRSDEIGAKAQFYLGELYAGQKMYPEAVTALVRVKTVYSAYDEWLTRSFLKLGDVYTEMKDYNKAKEMYRVVISKHKGDVYGNEARTKLRALK